MVRIARHSGWTHEEMLRQPLSYVYQLAADAMLENESIKAGSGSSSGGSSGGGQRIIRYTMKPQRRVP